MLFKTQSASVYGIDAYLVQVEVDVSFGMPMFIMVGLPDASVRESRDRVRAAIKNSGFEFPPHRITVNLAPADVRKAGRLLDWQPRVSTADGVSRLLDWIRHNRHLFTV